MSMMVNQANEDSRRTTAKKRSPKRTFDEEKETGVGESKQRTPPWSQRRPFALLNHKRIIIKYIGIENGERGRPSEQ